MTWMMKSVLAVILILVTPMPVVPSTTLPPPTCTHSFVLLDGSCYKGIKVSATWPEALAYCEVFGAELAIIKSQQEQTAVEGYLKTLHDPEYGSTDHHQYWFGANDFVTEGDWKWAVTTETINYTNWRPGNPDNGGDDKDYDEEHCAEMSEEHSWQWNDNGCEEEKHFLCEMINEEN
ncbi:perlucin-like isoform X2 [Mizuhopecten yessoensis]|uniref:perlucin-like isoform X2 n=1 Tax=Mizuhopecten yessoensis TaxID=6573 RepID=UPI000B45C9D0|nr:perlucin-like isoform X2 [Mizuhopecten yessoensis]